MSVADMAQIWPCIGCGVGQRYSSDLTPSLGTSTVAGTALKKQKEEREREREKERKKERWEGGREGRKEKEERERKQSY